MSIHKRLLTCNLVVGYSLVEETRVTQSAMTLRKIHHFWTDIKKKEYSEKHLLFAPI